MMKGVLSARLWEAETFRMDDLYLTYLCVGTTKLQRALAAGDGSRVTIRKSVRLLA